MKCNICTLMNGLNLRDSIPAMCCLDYAMSKAGGTDKFVRKHKPASGEPCCDCGYKKKARKDS